MTVEAIGPAALTPRLLLENALEETEQAQHAVLLLFGRGDDGRIQHRTWATNMPTEFWALGQLEIHSLASASLHGKLVSE